MFLLKSGFKNTIVTLKHNDSIGYLQSHRSIIPKQFSLLSFVENSKKIL